MLLSNKKTMSNKAYRASINRTMRGHTNDSTRDIAIKSITPRKARETSPYKETLKHIRVSTKLGSRINIALEHDSARLSREASRILTEYEAYIKTRYAHGEESLKAYRQYPKMRVYKFARWVHDYARKDRRNTRQLLDEVLAWDRLHGHDRIPTTRKIHAIVGTWEHPILRTA